MPVIYDPATTAAATFARTPFAGNAIPVERIDPVALSLLQRYPLPTSSGTANNYRRTAQRTRRPGSMGRRVSTTGSRRTAIQLFARITEFRDRFTPGDAAARRQRCDQRHTRTTGTLSQCVRVELPAHLSANLLNELRVGDTRRRVSRDRDDAWLRPRAWRWSTPGIPSNARFPTTLPTFLISGYQQLGSPPNTASHFNTSVTEIADTLTWVTGRHTWKFGADWRWERLNVIQPPSPTGSFTFNSLGSDLPGVANSGTPLASFLLGQVQTFSIDLQQSAIRERARFAEHFVQDDWKVDRPRLTVNAGLRYTLNFPSTEINGQTAVFNLETQQLEYPGYEAGSPAEEEQLRSAARPGVSGDGQDGLSSGYGLVWIEMAGITTPFTTPTFPFLQTVSQRALDTISPAFVLQQRPDDRAHRADTDCRTRARRVRGGPHARVRVCAAVERRGPAGAHAEYGR